MPYVDIEDKIPRVFIDYVNSVRESAGLPSADILPALPALADEVVARPVITFSTESFVIVPTQKNFILLKLRVDLHTSARGTTPTEESEWIASLRAALTDEAAAFAYWGALSEEARAGWRINGYRFTGGGTEYNAEAKTRIRRTELEVRCQAEGFMGL